MVPQELHVVTGAFGYSGRSIAERLLQRGYRVRTLTNSLERANPFGGRVEAHPFHFDQPDKLRESLRGAAVLYNTYWVRFNAGEDTHARAVENTKRLFAAARAAGVRRIVHISITNPSIDSDLEYFRGKAELERALMDCGPSYAILRPAVLFGREDILINNIAWGLRHMPVFAMFGRGRYRLQPIFVDDLAALAVEQGGRGENGIIDAVGPETFTYRQLVETIGAAIGRRRWILPMPPRLAHGFSRLVGLVLGDVIITRDEIRGLMRNLLCTDSPPAGQTRLSEWRAAHADTLGIRYAAELARRRDRRTAYADL